MTSGYPYELKLPLAPYRFVWRDEPAVDAEKHAGNGYAEERYTHADGTTTIIREYQADGSYHIMSDRAEIELIDNAGNPCSEHEVSRLRRVAGDPLRNWMDLRHHQPYVMLVQP